MNLIGAGNALDTEKYFIITLDPLGGGCSTSPATTEEHEFPSYSVADMVETEIDLVDRKLGLRHLLAVVGVSQGAFEGLQLGVDHPGLARALVLMVPAARCDRNCQKSIWEMEGRITADPLWQGGAYTANPTNGLFEAGKFYFSPLYSDRYVEEVVAKSGETATWTVGTNWRDNWDAKSLILRYDASKSFDIGTGQGGIEHALRKIKAKVLIMRSASDRLLTYMGPQDPLVRFIPHATVDDIPSYIGHMACCQNATREEYAFVRAHLATYLASLAMN